jgi:hypothetical protein
MGNETMMRKKADGKTQASSRQYLAARMLSGAVRATLPVTPPEETWRSKQLSSKNGFRR